MSSFAAHSPEHYFKAFNVFIAKSKLKVTDIVRSHMPSVVQRLLPKCQQRLCLNVLGVGSGTGETDMEIVKTIKQELRKNQQSYDMKIYHRAIEPNVYACGIFKAATENLPSLLDDQQIQFDIWQQTFQEYEQSQKEPTKFDIVHFMHSIYYLDIEQTLAHCLDKELSDGGQIVCLVEGKDLLHWLLAKQRQTSHEEGSSENKDAADKIIEIAGKNGWKYEMYTQDHEIDVTEVFDVNSIEGNLLLDFLTHTVNFRETSDKQLVEEVLTLIKNLTIVKDGKYIGEKKESLVIIYK